LHLPQTQTQLTPTLDLGVDLITQPLIGSQPFAKIESDTAAADTDNAGQMQVQETPRS
jgi:hypothetical protein